MGISRYPILIDLVRKHRPKSIVEIGTFNGVRALEMVSAALEYNTGVHYTGYDLFDTSDLDVHTREFNFSEDRNDIIKKPYPMSQLSLIFDQSPLQFTHELIKGDTRETLREHHDDFVFIDGGHSVKTIRMDYEKVKNCKVVVFDDYYRGYAHTDKFGCNVIVDEIPNARIYESDDPSVHGGTICIAEVINA